MGKRVYLRGFDKILEKRKALFCPPEGRKFERRAACCVAIVGRARPAGLLRSKCVPRTAGRAADMSLPKLVRSAQRAWPGRGG